VIIHLPQYNAQYRTPAEIPVSTLWYPIQFLYHSQRVHSMRFTQFACWSTSLMYARRSKSYPEYSGPTLIFFVFFSNQHSFFTWERRIRSLIWKLPYSFQREITRSQLQALMVPHFSPMDSSVVNAESDFPVLRQLDSFVHKIDKNWGRYLYIRATRNTKDA
jgi:hypothetical protein